MNCVEVQWLEKSEQRWALHHNQLLLMFNNLLGSYCCIYCSLEGPVHNFDNQEQNQD